MNASAGSVSNNFSKDNPCFTNRQTKESSSRGYIKGLYRILAKIHIKMLKNHRVWNSKVWASGDKTIKTIPRCAKRLSLSV